VDAILKDDEARSRWSRYHLIRDAIQEDSRSPLDVDFASRVSAAIQEEPAIVALPPSVRETAKRHSADQQAEQDAQKAAPGNVVQGKFKRSLVGLSVAATVAMVSLVGLNTLQTSRDAAPDNSVAVVPSTDTVLPAGSAGVGGDIQFVSNPVGSYWVSQERTISPESEQRLNMYLSQHIEHSPTADVTGMLPYSRLAGYDTPGRRNSDEENQSQEQQ